MNRSVPVRATKHHGLGNDFLVVLDPANDINPTQVIAWCHRRTGIGADGLIAAQRVDGSDDHWSMVLWNADGSQAEISGNGVRCLAQAIGLQLELDVTSELLVDTDAGPRRLTVYPEPGATWSVRAGMGAATVGPDPSAAWIDADVTIVGQLGVDVGNPHVVGLVDAAAELERIDMADVGPVIAAGYPGGINVHVGYVAGPDDLHLKVWERGVGVTQACGTGACAAAWATHRMGLTGPIIAVTMPGGSATVELNGSEVCLVGPATYVGSVVLG